MRQSGVTPADATLPRPTPIRTPVDDEPTWLSFERSMLSAHTSMKKILSSSDTPSVEDRSAMQVNVGENKKRGFAQSSSASSPPDAFGSLLKRQEEQTAALLHVSEEEWSDPPFEERFDTPPPEEIPPPPSSRRSSIHTIDHPDAERAQTAFLRRELRRVENIILHATQQREKDRTHSLLSDATEPQQSRIGEGSHLHGRGGGGGGGGGGGDGDGVGPLEVVVRTQTSSTHPHALEIAGYRPKFDAQETWSALWLGVWG